MSQKTWEIEGREVVWASYSSGRDQTFKIHILWSRKLGITLKTKFRSCKEAQEIVRKIETKGKINPEFWEKTYFPYPGWGEGFSD